MHKGYKLFLKTSRGLQPLNELKRLYKGFATSRTFGPHSLLMPANQHGPISVWTNVVDLRDALRYLDALLMFNSLHASVSVDCWEVWWLPWRGPRGNWEHDDDVSVDGSKYDPPASVKLARAVVLHKQIESPKDWLTKQLEARTPKEVEAF
jgi:hypothetical protein